MSAGEEEIYREHVLDHYEDPYHRGHAPQTTHQHQLKNPLCGDKIEMTLALDSGGQIREIYFDGEGCCISQASASMLTEQLDGKTIDDVKKFSATDMLELFGARLTPSRQKCCLLAWQTLQQAIHSPVDGPAQETS